MAFRDLMAKRLRNSLETGEQVQLAVLAQAGVSPYVSIGSPWTTLLRARPKIIVVTNKNVIMLNGRRLIPTRPTGPLVRLPRQTVFGQMSGGLWSAITLNGEQMWVHKRRYKDLAASDAAISTSASPDPSESAGQSP